MEIKAALEGLLFLATEPLSAKELAERLGIEESTAEELVQELAREYEAREGALEIVRLGGGYRLCTKPELGPLLAKHHEPPSKLSPAALEVLAIVAYRQPVTRSQIDQIRGVRSERALASLVERDLVTEVGRAEGPGRPILYGTTDTFLETFGLNALEDLPPLPSPLPNTQGV
ncbi:MAG: SMC-Scp complex subunit ScpB [Firmicutes bacterium]|jgi:segregation and condensation protein B|nr:SMC-Scp complex subunit ScpB [Bacillota bacterium]HOB22868.1 SMC-Scp complex subunit ScpB [Bacillota bacterium]HQD39442.1 SMC-Scp complex subunit ScpB [Bacillota bacterium]